MKSTKINLNNSSLNATSSTTTTPTTEEPPVNQNPNQTISTLVEAPEDGAVLPIVNGKRKLRSSRTTDPESKRQKVSTTTKTTSKDHTPPSTRLSDLGGVDACIEKMLEYIAMPLCHPEIYLHTGIQPPRGVLLHGPPGCGKTMLAGAMAGVRSSSLTSFVFLFFLRFRFVFR